MLKSAKKILGWLSLTSLGIGAVIGSASLPSSARQSPGKGFSLFHPERSLLEYLIHHSASFGRPGAGPAIALSSSGRYRLRIRIGVLRRACRQ